MIMSRLYSPIGRRHRVATSALVGAIGIFLSAAAAPGKTTYSAASGVETVAQAPVTSSPGAAAATATAADTSIRPFHIRVSDEALADLRRRIAATKWPKQKTVTDASQGVQLATMRELARHWEKDYDWRKVESTLNALPQFNDEHRRVEIHFIHVLIALSRARCLSIASNRT
jgi:hypothetical protein